MADAAEVRVVAMPLPGQEGMKRVMKVVRPLAVESEAPFFPRLIIWRRSGRSPDQVDLSQPASRESRHPLAPYLREWDGAQIEDAVDASTLRPSPGSAGPVEDVTMK
jgi:hypothetical protein